MLVDMNFHVYDRRCQPIKGHVRKSLLTNVNLKMDFHNNSSLKMFYLQICTIHLHSVSLFQGIYRVSGVKSKVERLCQTFETNEGEVDLSEHPPVVIANVLKLYLRQVQIGCVVLSVGWQKYPQN